MARHTNQNKEEDTNQNKEATATFTATSRQSVTTKLGGHRSSSIATAPTSMWRSLISWCAFDEVLTSAAIRHQVILHLLDPEIRRGQDGKFARRILAIHLSRARPYPCRCAGQCSHSCRRAKWFVSPEPNIDTSFSHIERRGHHGELSGSVGASACAGLSADECRCQHR